MLISISFFILVQLPRLIKVHRVKTVSPSAFGSFNCFLLWSNARVSYILFGNLFFATKSTEKGNVEYRYQIVSTSMWMVTTAIKVYLSVKWHAQVAFSTFGLSPGGHICLQFIIQRYVSFIEASKSTVKYSFQYTGLFTIQVSLQYSIFKSSS